MIVSSTTADGITDAVKSADNRSRVDLTFRRWRIAACTASLLFAIGWTVTLGKDLHWDAVNYHLYSGFSALNDRFTLDFFGAGTPAYVNPYANVPLYLMWRADWPALWMALAFATFHAGLLWLAFELALVAGIRRGRRELPAFALLAVVLTATNPVLLQGLGSTMSDPSVSVLVLAGWLAIAHTLRYGHWRTAAIAGALCGIAAALKLSNAVYAIAAVPALAIMPGSIAARSRGIAVFSGACAAGFVIAALPWSWQLWREFRNPFFPFLNEYFQSPDFTTSPLKQERFIPLTWQAFLFRPFEMLSAASAVHVEPRAPDLRYAALLAALAAWVSARWRCAPTRAIHDAGASDDLTAAGRCMAGMLVGLAVAWCLWLAISGNGRYFLPMACVASVVLALVLQRIYIAWPTATITAAILIVTMQLVQLALGSDLKRDGYAWEGPWFRTEIPDRLRTEPYFFLSPGILSGSIFVPYLHPESGMMNIGGFNVIGPRHPGGERAQKLIEHNATRLRFLLALPEGVVDRKTLPGPPNNLRGYFRRFGLRIDGSDCEFLRLEGNVRGERRPMKDKWKHFISCRLVIAPGEREAYEREVGFYDAIFDRVEAVCPQLFFPARPVTQEFLYWARTYHSGSEMQLFVDEGRVKYFFYLRGGEPIDIGSVADWRKGPQPVDCSVRTKPAFTNITR
jgi:hypothetical protein